MRLAFSRRPGDSERNEECETYTDRVGVRSDDCGMRDLRRSRKCRWGPNTPNRSIAQLPIIKDPEVVRYINVLGDSIARLADDRSLDWQFFVVNSSR